MRTGKWELVIVWETGETQIFEYDTREAAQRGEGSMRMANGNQIKWSCVRPQYN